MQAIRVQYLLTYAILGCVLPYLPVFLRSRGMDQTDVGLVFAIASAAVLLAPVLVTLLADTHFDPRSLMAGLLVVAAAALVGMSMAHAIALLIVGYGLHALAMTPVMPLQDGLLFSLHAQNGSDAGAAGRAAAPLKFHRVRVWGTIGFIIPALALFWLLRAGLRLELTLWAGAGCALAAAINARGVVPAPRRTQQLDAALADAGPKRLPTLAALRALREPHLLVFCCATFLLSAATAAYYAFYPIYLTEIVGIDTQWIGLIASAGVVVEIFFMLGFGRLLDLLGMKWLVVTGFLATAARLALLAAFPNVAVAVATQGFHGLMVLMIAVVPPVFLNDHAEPRFRHSMQGVYTMLVMGLARIAGNTLAGPVAQRSLALMFWLAAAVATLAAVLVVVAFRHPAREEAPVLATPLAKT